MCVRTSSFLSVICFLFSSQLTSFLSSSCKMLQMRFAYNGSSVSGDLMSHRHLISSHSFPSLFLFQNAQCKTHIMGLSLSGNISASSCLILSLLVSFCLTWTHPVPSLLFFSSRILKVRFAHNTVVLLHRSTQFLVSSLFVSSDLVLPLVLKC